MAAPLSKEELVSRARAELDTAELAYSETLNFGRTAARTNRLRAAKRRARAFLRRAVRKGLTEGQARNLYESAPPDPEFGATEW